MDPNNPDMDGDEVKDGADADSPILNEMFVRTHFVTNQMISKMFPPSPGAGNQNALRSIGVEARGGNVQPIEPAPWTGPTASTVGITYKAQQAVQAAKIAREEQDQCGGFSKVTIDPEMDAAFYQFKTTAEGEGTLTIRITGTPICKKTGEPHPLSPLTWKVTSEKVLFAYDPQPRTASEAFSIDLPPENVDQNALGVHGVLSRRGAQTAGSGRSLVRAELGNKFGTANGDPKFWGMDRPSAQNFLLVGLRDNCTADDKSFQYLIMEALDESQNGATVGTKQWGLIFEPRFPAGAPKCSPFLESPGASYGWKLPFSLNASYEDPEAALNRFPTFKRGVDWFDGLTGSAALASPDTIDLTNVF
jgi:hypothetical protein